VNDGQQRSGADRPLAAPGVSLSNGRDDDQNVKVEGDVSETAQRNVLLAHEHEVSRGGTVLAACLSPFYQRDRNICHYFQNITILYREIQYTTWLLLPIL
jgi:hypothetical protein